MSRSFAFWLISLHVPEYDSIYLESENQSHFQTGQEDSHGCQNLYDLRQTILLSYQRVVLASTSSADLLVI
jgi:hypothetical protein